MISPACDPESDVVRPGGSISSGRYSTPIPGRLPSSLFIVRGSGVSLSKSRELPASITLDDMEIECINTKLLARSSMAVKIVKMDSPTMFWVQLKTGEDFQDLFEKLTRRMTRRGHMLRHRPNVTSLSENS
ncbi:hypothetical protein G5I_07163 [Acromyrmex echinatior]|uniref:Uncharacterized protein n=1 Tax=Acromyrmex echinatior TaxID=103372 RepID=F4WN19_ACREC|nr:hypothetical protein G5I_07163 [Acromyrmex echinatior]